MSEAITIPTITSANELAAALREMTGGFGQDFPVVITSTTGPWTLALAKNPDASPNTPAHVISIVSVADLQTGA